MTTTTTSWTVEIPNFLPTPLNQLMRMNRHKRNRILKSEYDLIAVYSRDVPKAKAKRRVILRLTLQPEVRRRDSRGKSIILDGADKERDDDGCFKGVLDGLVKAGMLVDDSRRWVERAPAEYEIGEQRKTTLTLEDMA